MPQCPFKSGHDQLWLNMADHIQRTRFEFWEGHVYIVHKSEDALSTRVRTCVHCPQEWGCIVHKSEDTLSTRVRTCVHCPQEWDMCTLSTRVRIHCPQEWGYIVYKSEDMCTLSTRVRMLHRGDQPSSRTDLSIYWVHPKPCLISARCAWCIAWDRMWSHVIACDRLHVIVCDRVWMWSHVIVCDHIRSHVIAYDRLWSYVIACDRIWSHVMWSHVIVCDRVWSCVIACDRMWSCVKRRNLLWNRHYICTYILHRVRTRWAAPRTRATCSVQSDKHLKRYISSVGRSSEIGNVYRQL